MGYDLDNIRAVVDKKMTNWAMGYKTGGFAGQFLMPDMFVDAASDKGKIPIFGKEHLKLYEDERALHSAIKTYRPDAITYVSYELSEHSFGYTYDVEEELHGKPLIDLKTYHTKALMDSANLKIEALIADAVQTATNYGAGNKKALTGNNCWDVSVSAHADSTPYIDIQTGIDAIYSATGTYPNVMVLGKASYDALKVHPHTIEKIKYSQKAVVTTDLISELISDKSYKIKVYVGESQYDAAGTLTELWGDNVVLAYVPPKMNKKAAMYTPAFGKLLVRNGMPQILNYNADNSGLVKTIAIRHYYQPKITMATAGYLITNTVT